MSSDHQLARELAEATGALLLDLLKQERNYTSGWGLDTLGDELAHQFLADQLAKERPDDALLSEEGADDRSRLDHDRVWIIDPLDGSADFGYSGQWSVHVALTESGQPTAGAVALPMLGVTYGTDPAAVPITDREGERPLVLVPRSRRYVDGPALERMLGADVAAVGSAGVKAMAVVRGEADAYVHAGGLYEWDTCAPVAVARAAGFACMHLDGSPLLFNRLDPYSPGLVLARPDFADFIIEQVAAARK